MRVSLEELRWKHKSSVGVSNSALKSGEGGFCLPRRVRQRVGGVDPGRGVSPGWGALSPSPCGRRGWGLAPACGRRGSSRQKVSCNSRECLLASGSAAANVLINVIIKHSLIMPPSCNCMVVGCHPALWAGGAVCVKCTLGITLVGIPPSALGILRLENGYLSCPGMFYCLFIVCVPVESSECTCCLCSGCPRSGQKAGMNKGSEGS